MGSKKRLQKHIGPILNKLIKDNDIKKYVEPCVGGANMIEVIECDLRVGNDILIQEQFYTGELSGSNFNTFTYTPYLSNTFCDPSFFDMSHNKNLHTMTDDMYIQHMIPHHQVAVDMSKKILKTTNDDFIIDLAYKIIHAQQSEITNLYYLSKSKNMFESNKPLNKGRMTQASHFSIERKAPMSFNDIENTEENLMKLVKEALKRLVIDLELISPTKTDIDEIAKVVGVCLSPY